MKLIAPQAPHTALFSNLLQPETEKTQWWKRLIVTGTWRGRLEVMFSRCRKKKNKPIGVGRLDVKLQFNEDENPALTTD